MQNTDKDPELDDTLKNPADTGNGDRTVSNIGSPPADPLIPVSELRQDLSMYDILSIIGNGATGIVYKAVHTKLGRSVAIKMLKPEYFQNQSFLEGFRKEAQLLSRIKHENVASVYDFIEIKNRYYLVMELIEGDSLSKVSKKGPMDEKRVLEMICGVLEGIRFTHNKNILHLDLKPSNILLNEYHVPVIIDFGISRIKTQDTKFENVVQVQGTPYYMSPEQYTSNIKLVDQRSDIYSIGVIFYQLLTGEVPFRGRDVREIGKSVLFEAPKRPSLINPKISKDLEAIVLKMIKKNPAARYPDVQEVIDDIKRYQRGEPVKAQKYDMLFLVWSAIRRNPLISSLVFLVIIIGLVFSGYYSYKKYQETPHWQKAFSENFNNDFSGRWLGYSGINEGFLVPVKNDNFKKYFCNRINVASFKKDMDLSLVSADTYDENIRLSFSMTVNPESSSVFGFFVDAAIPEMEFGYILCFKNGEIQLIRDNLSSTPLWSGKYDFKNDRTYYFVMDVVDGRVILSINKTKIMDFQDFVTWFSKKEYRFGFFAKSCDLEISSVNLYQLNTALLISQLSIGDRFFQLGRFEDAIDEYSRVINKYPENKIAMEAYYLRGLAKQKNNMFIDAVVDFEILLSYNTIDDSFKGKILFQKGICHLSLGELQKSCQSFDQAINAYNIESLRSNVLGTLVHFCREKLKRQNPKDIIEAEYILKYLLGRNIPSRITFVDIVKRVVLYYFDSGEYEKSIENLDLIIKYYSMREDLVAFAYWKKGRAYMELSGLEEEGTIKEQYLKKAIYWFTEVLVRCPGVRFYDYYSNEELAKAYRAMGDFKKANDYEKKKSEYKDIFS